MASLINGKHVSFISRLTFFTFLSSFLKIILYDIVRTAHLLLETWQWSEAQNDSDDHRLTWTASLPPSLEPERSVSWLTTLPSALCLFYTNIQLILHRHYLIISNPSAQSRDRHLLFSGVCLNKLATRIRKEGKNAQSYLEFSFLFSS